VIIPDINLLLYAHVSAVPEHERARAWWEALLNGSREVGIAAPVLFGFVRLATNPRAWIDRRRWTTRWCGSKRLRRCLH
jgi:predicted nucleic acid-binding protein